MRIHHAINPLTTTGWNGKQNKFTQSFHNNMYEDTRIDSMNLRFQREKLHKINITRKEQEKLEVFNEFKTKSMIMKYFK